MSLPEFGLCLETSRQPQGSSCHWPLFPSLATPEVSWSSSAPESRDTPNFGTKLPGRKIKEKLGEPELQEEAQENLQKKSFTPA